MNECEECGADIEEKTIDKMIYEWATFVTERAFNDFIKNSEYMSVFDDFIRNKSHSVACEVIMKRLDGDRIVDEAVSIFEKRVGSTLKSIKEFRDDVIHGRIQEMSYLSVAKPEVRFDEMLKQLFEMKSDIENLKKSFLIVQKRIKDDN